MWRDISDRWHLRHASLGVAGDRGIAAFGRGRELSRDPGRESGGVRGLQFGEGQVAALRMEEHVVGVAVRKGFPSCASATAPGERLRHGPGREAKLLMRSAPRKPRQSTLSDMMRSQIPCAVNVSRGASYTSAAVAALGSLVGDRGVGPPLLTASGKRLMTLRTSQLWTTADHHIMAIAALARRKIQGQGTTRLLGRRGSHGVRRGHKIGSRTRGRTALVSVMSGLQDFGQARRMELKKRKGQRPSN